MGSAFGAHARFAFLQLTYVDFLAYNVLDLYRIFDPKCLDGFPNLKAFLSRFEVSLLMPLLVAPFLCPPLPGACLAETKVRYMHHSLRPWFVLRSLLSLLHGLCHS